MDPGWWIVRGPNGGYLAAVLLRAFAQAVNDPARAARSVSIHFLRPPTEGSMRIETTVERTGRSLTTISGRMWQEDRLCVTGMAAFAMARDAPDFQDSVMPAVVGPEALPRLHEVHKRTVPIRDRYDQRVVPSETLGGEGEGVGGGWIRTMDPHAADAALVAAFTDGWPPAVWQRFGPDGEPMIHSVPTIDLTVHFRRTLPLSEATPEDFYLAVFRTRMAMEGFIEEDGEIWTADGLLLAHSRQLGLLM